MHSLGASNGGHVLAMRLAVPPGANDAMCEYLTADAFPRVMAFTGVVACHLYATDEGASYVRTAESSTRAFDVPSCVLLCEASHATAAAKAKNVSLLPIDSEHNAVHQCMRAGSMQEVKRIWLTASGGNQPSSSPLSALSHLPSFICSLRSATTGSCWLVSCSGMCR